VHFNWFLGLKEARAKDLRTSEHSMEDPRGLIEAFSGARLSESPVAIRRTKGRSSALNLNIPEYLTK